MFAGFLEKHVVLVPILMTLKQEVMEDGQPGDFYKLVMDLPVRVDYFLFVFGTEFSEEALCFQSFLQLQTCSYVEC